MSIHRYYLQSGLLALMMLCTVGLSRAQETPFALTVRNPERTISVGAFTEFEITLTNSDRYDHNIRVIRIVDEMPDSSWYSSICSLVECYPKEVDTIPVQTIYGDGGSLITFVHVITARVAGVARVTLRFETLDGKFVLAQDLEVTASLPGGVEQPAIAIDVPAYPNPAATSAMIPLPALHAREAALQLDLHDARGERVADLTAAARNAHDAGAGEVRVDLRGVPAGYYRYRLVAGGLVRSGALIVAH